MSENINPEHTDIDDNNEINGTTKPQPFIHEPLYKELLTHYQNANWEESDKIISELLKRYPDNESLLDFQKEVSVRHFLQENNDETEKIEQKERRKQNVIKGAIAAAIVVVVIFIATLAINTYRNQLIQAQLDREREARLMQMEAIYKNAEDYMQAEKWQSALDSLQTLTDEYSDLLKDHPDYENVPADIATAEEMLVIEEKYQDGIEFFNQGDNENAMAIFNEILSEYPNYDNVAILINRIENSLEVERLFEEAKSNFAEENWIDVVENYNSIIAIDGTADLSGLNEELFLSYENLMIETAEKKDATVDDIKTAETYYQNAKKIFPQDKEHASWVEELDRVAIDLLAKRYYLFAKEIIELNTYSINAYEEALSLLEEANDIGSGSVVFTNEISNITLYLNAFKDMRDHKWEEAITKLNELLRIDPNYADGFAKYMLYEAYTARGDIFFTYGENTNAIEEYDLAAIIAYGDDGNPIMLFETLVNSANTLQRLDLVTESASYFHDAVVLIGFSDKVSSNPEAAAEINSAEYAYQTNNFWEATNLYQIALENTDLIYDFETLEVERGDSLLHIAFDYGTTLSAISEFNDLGDSLMIRNSMELKIPVLNHNQE